MAFSAADLVWNFTAIPDRAPNVELIRDPERQARGALRLDYKMDDDYGVVEAKGHLCPEGRAILREAASDHLLARPNLDSRCRRRAPKHGTAQTTHDLPSIRGPAPT